MAQDILDLNPKEENAIFILVISIGQLIVGNLVLIPVDLKDSDKDKCFVFQPKMELLVRNKVKDQVPKT